ncbi:hypothetical protein [Brasilonema bromeliae]|uniref:hypothetical protein n=2 Tax=Brasilonema bromeliae TaxID=383615 RepID=UPI00145F85FE
MTFLEGDRAAVMNRQIWTLTSKQKRRLSSIAKKLVLCFFASRLSSLSGDLLSRRVNLYLLHAYAALYA